MIGRRTNGFKIFPGDLRVITHEARRPWNSKPISSKTIGSEIHSNYRFILLIFILFVFFFSHNGTLTHFFHRNR